MQLWVRLRAHSFVMLRVVLVVNLLLFVSSLHSVAMLPSLSPTPYVNREHSFHIYPPSGWTVDERSARDIQGAIVFFWGPYESDTGGTVNVLICSKIVSSTMSLEECVSREKPTLTSLPYYRILSEQKRNINELPCIELVGTTVGTTTRGTFTLKQKQVVFVQKGKMYWLSFMASLKYYEMYLSAFEESLQTFKLGLPEITSFATPPILALVAIGTSTIALVGAYLVYSRRRTAKRLSTSLGFRRVTCPNCGSEIVVDSENKTCRKCGASLA